MNICKMLSYIVLHIPAACVALSKPMPIYTTRKQLRVINNNLCEISILSHYTNNNALLHDLIINPINLPHIEEIIEQIDIHKALDIVTLGVTNVTIARTLMRKIGNYGYISDERVNAITTLIRQYPELLECLRSNPSIGIYHLISEVPDRHIHSFTNSNELLYFYKLGILSRNNMLLSSIYVANKELVDYLVTEDPINDAELFIYYRYYGKLPNSPERYDHALTDYLRLLHGLEPLYHEYNNCLQLAYIAHHDELFDERVVLSILTRTSLGNTLHKLNNVGYNYPSTGVHKLLFVAVLNNLMDYNDINNIQLDNCKLCRRIRESY